VRAVSAVEPARPERAAGFPGLQIHPYRSQSPCPALGSLAATNQASWNASALFAAQRAELEPVRRSRAQRYGPATRPSSGRAQAPGLLDLEPPHRRLCAHRFFPVFFRGAEPFHFANVVLFSATAILFVFGSLLAGHFLRPSAPTARKVR